MAMMVFTILLLGLSSVRMSRLPSSLSRSSSLSSCSGGANSCIFPYIYENRIHTSCTTIEDPGKPWCATKLDSTRNMKEWAYCAADCPGVADGSDFVSPDNQPGKCFCGVPNVLDAAAASERITGGYETQDGEFPWQVALVYGRKVGSQRCGGTLVGDRYVVTAAHCLKGYAPWDIQVLVGDTSLAVETEADSLQVKVLSFKKHPDYNSTSNENDIAILELKTAVDLLSFPNIKPVCLPSAGKTFGGQLAVVAGWGMVASQSNMVANLNEVTVRIYADGSCGLMDYYKTEDMICAGVLEGGKDACQGDSGGPLVTPDDENNGAATLAGVVSWGLGCGVQDRLGIYAEVAHFRPWLDQELSGLVTCPPPPSSSWQPSLTEHSHDETTETPAPPPAISLQGGSSSQGNVLVHGKPICDDRWEDVDASVVCRSLGFSQGFATGGSYFGKDGSDYAMDDIECTGEESDIMDCLYNEQHDCFSGEGAGVVCF